MGGIVGRLFREFAVALSVAILVSMVISLTTTPMMCAHLLKHEETHGRLYRASERFFNWIVETYGRTLNTVLNYSFVTLMILFATIGLTVYLFIQVPKRLLRSRTTWQALHWARCWRMRTHRFRR